MKKFMFLMFLLGISFYSLAGQDGKDILGTWKYKVETDQGDITGTLVFQDKEGAVAGEVRTDDGQILSFSKIEWKEDNAVYMELDTGYELMEITVTLDGSSFAGTVESQSGSFPLTGEKTE
jgi:hypothetical protein